MKYVRRIVWLIFVILLGIFALRNQTYLGRQVDLVFFKEPVSLVLGFWLVLCFLMGLLVYMILDFPRDIAMKRDLRRKAKEITRLQAELDRHLNPAGGAIRPPPPSNPAQEKRPDL